jgi:hypothetical protein
MDNHEPKQPPVPAPDAGDAARDRPFDGASDLPGRQLNDPDEQAAAGVHRHPIHPQRRGGGPR